MFDIWDFFVINVCWFCWCCTRYIGIVLTTHICVLDESSGLLALFDLAVFGAQPQCG